MKKLIIMLLTFLVLAFAFVFMYWYNYSGKMISKGVEDIEEITITVYPNNKEKTETTVVNDIETIYNILNKTTKIQNVYTELPQWDSKFKINIFYRNGEQEQIFSTERTGSIFKYLNGAGSSGGRGYRRGENQLVWDYVFNK